MSHWMVHMGRLDHLNPGSSYAFPTVEAAKFFALNHKRRDPHRDIRIETPAGTTIEVPLTPGDFYERKFADEMEMSEQQQAAADRAATARVRDEAGRWEIPA